MSELTSAPEPSIAAVVVTHNRLVLLQECVAALRAQTRKVNELIVVNNGSTDGTAKWLAEQNDLTVAEQVNLGSSGGQYTGIKTAYGKGHDWFWCMDDDTIPDPDALAKLISCPKAMGSDIGFLGSLELSTERAVGLHPPRTIKSEDWCLTVGRDHCVRVETATFVSLLVARRAVARAGLPAKNFFLWFDDWEFTERISRYYSGYVVLDSLVVHKVKRDRQVADLKCPANVRKVCLGTRNEVAWMMSKPTITWLSKLAFALRLGASRGHQVLIGRLPPLVLWWFVKGLFMKVQVDFAEASDPQAPELTNSSPASH